jgi:hypothetical protein
MREFLMPTKFVRLEQETTKKMMKQLCDSYPSFKKFYSDNVSEICKIDLKWIIKPDLKVDGISSPITDTITLKKYPETIEDSRIVAHEIVHELIWREGYPYLMADPHTEASICRTLEASAREIQAIIYEPMVEARLKKYFDNLCSDNVKNSMAAAEKMVTEKDRILEEIKNPRALLFYCCQYLKRRLLIEATCNSSDATDYIRLYEQNFRENIVPCGEKVLSLIERKDHTPQEVKTIFEEILSSKKFSFSYQYQNSFNRFLLTK